MRPLHVLGDEVRYVRPSQAQYTEPSFERCGAFRVSSDGVFDSRNEEHRRAMVDSYRRRSIRMLRAVQLDNPLPF